MNIFHRIKSVNLVSIETDSPIANVPCGECTKCCEILSPNLTPAEISSGKYPLSLSYTDEGPLVTIFRKPGGGCAMFVDNKCSIYEERPLACRQFDCRKSHHLKTNDVALSKFGVVEKEESVVYYNVENFIEDEITLKYWFVLKNYNRVEQLDEYIKVACEFVQTAKNRNSKFKFIYDDLYKIYNENQLNQKDRNMIETALKTASYNWSHGNE